MKKLLIYGDYYKKTGGYNRNISDLLPFLEKSWEIALVAVGWNGIPINSDYRIYPTDIGGEDDFWGASVLAYALEDFEPDVVLTIGDFFSNKRIGFQLSSRARDGKKQWKWVCWDTLDADPLDFPSREPIQWVDYVLGYSDFAIEEIKKIFPDINAERLYPPINPKTFYKKDEAKENARKEFGSEHVLVTCGRNQLRKNIPVLLDAMELLLENKDYADTILILASGVNPKDEDDNFAGYALDKFIAERGLDKNVIDWSSMDTAITDELLNSSYNMADAYITVSTAEGFCLPIAEAGISGIPSIYTNCSAMPEFAQGVPIEPSAYYYNQIGGRTYMVSPEDIVNSILRFYNSDATEWSKKSEEFAKTLTPESRAKKFTSILNKVLKKDLKCLRRQ